MLRVVLDTNVLLSGPIMLGKPRELLSMISRREATLVLSKEILNELTKVTRRKKLTEYATEKQIERFVESLERIAEFVEPESHLEVADGPEGFAREEKDPDNVCGGPGGIHD